MTCGDALKLMQIIFYTTTGDGFTAPLPSHSTTAESGL